MKQTNNSSFKKDGKIYSGVTSPETEGITKRVQSFIEDSGTLAYTTDGSNYTKVATTDIITPVNQQSEVIHLSPTREGFIDELKLSSAPVQYVSENVLPPVDIAYYSGVTTNNSQKSLGIYVLNGTFEINNANPKLISSLPVSKLVQTVRVEILSGSTTAVTSYFALYRNGEYGRIKLNAIGGVMTIPANNEMAFYIMNMSELCSFTNYAFRIEAIEGDYTFANYPIYVPYTGQPSPDNHIPINVVNSPVKVVSRGNNLLPPAVISDFDSIIVDNTRKDEGIYVFNGEFETIQQNPQFISQMPISSKIQTFRIIVLSGTNTSTSGKFALYEPYPAAFYKTIEMNSNGGIIIIPPNTKCGFNLINGNELFTITNLTIRLEVLEGEYTFENYPPYAPYDSHTTSLPLVIESGEHAGQIAELLGEYNTETNVLVQDYTKLSFSQVSLAYGSGQDNVSTNTIYFNFKTTFNVINYAGGLCTMFESTRSNVYVPTNVNVNKFTTYLIDNTIGVRADRSLFGIEFSDSVETRLQKLNAVFITKPIEFYIKRATPEILTLKPTPPVPTLAGTTNIYAINNAAPVMFDVTELLLQQNRRNVVLESTLSDGTKINDMPYTVSSQVEVDTLTGKTLDIELESIEASISDVKAELSTEVTAREKGDTYIRTELVDGTLIPQKAVNAENVTTNINGKAITSIFEDNGTTVKNATNAIKVQNVDLSLNSVSQFGNFVMPKRKPLYGIEFSLSSSSNQLSKTIQFGESISMSTLEIYYTESALSGNTMFKTAKISIGTFEPNNGGQENIITLIFLGDWVFNLQQITDTSMQFYLAGTFEPYPVKVTVSKIVKIVE